MRRTKKNLKATQKLSALLGVEILRLGGVSIPRMACKEWRIETIHGPLLVTVFETDLGHMTIFGCFEVNPQFIGAELGVNPYSGKWNLHMSSERPITPEETVKAWLYRVQPLLKPARWIDADPKKLEVLKKAWLKD